MCLYKSTRRNRRQLMGTDKQNGWNEYSRLVLAELEKINKKIDENTQDINELRQDLTKLESIKDEMSDVKGWKKEVDEVVSPTQMKELSKEVDELKTFKTKSTTIWVAIQIIFGILATLFGWYLKSSS